MGSRFNTLKIVTGVLVVGGGIGGCMAAIRARLCGADVILVEKGNTLRSGSAATGTDHFWTYVPDLHGPLGFTVSDLVIDHTRAAHGFNDQRLTEFQAVNSFERLLDLEKWGVRIRDKKGSLIPLGKIHRVKTFMHIQGRDLKRVLSGQAQKVGVDIQNRTMIVELLVSDGRVVGALAIRSRTQELVVFLAKAVVLATGGVTRLYKNPSGVLFNTAISPAVTGDGRAMAFRAGAKLVNMEFTPSFTGIANFQRCGRGSYYPGGVLKDAHGKPLMEIISGEHIDMGVESPLRIQEVVRSGRGPVYMDCSGASESDLEYIRWALSNEGQSGFLSWLDEEGIGLRTHKLGFSVYECFLGPGGQGIKANQKGETSVPGLYVCGDDMGGGYRSVTPGAATFGWTSGENASRYASGLEYRGSADDTELCVGRLMRQCEAMLSRQRGASWQDANLALQNLMSFHARDVRSETMLSAGLSSIQEFQQLLFLKLKAANAHELLHCFEILNLATVGEIVIRSSLWRKESRMELEFFRPDYPKSEGNEHMTFTVVQLKDGEVGVTSEKIDYKYEWRH